MPVVGSIIAKLIGKAATGEQETFFSVPAPPAGRVVWNPIGRPGEANGPARSFEGDG
jgi:hypothetical protein